MTEEQRMEEGRRMFQIFAARMFEQRVLTAYREKVAQERQKKLLEELEEETRQDVQREQKRAKEAQKKKDKKRLQKLAKDEERARKEAEKAAEEAAQRALEEKKAEEQRLKREEQRKKKEAEKKAQEEERLRKEAEKQKRLQEERERQAEQERKHREAKEREKKKKEEARKKEREEREVREKELREKKEREDQERREKEARARADAEAKERARKEELAAQQEALAAAAASAPPPPVHSVPTPSLKRPAPVPSLPVPPGLPAQPQLRNLKSPLLQIATPAVPKAIVPVRARQASQQGSEASSPNTPLTLAKKGQSASPSTTSQQSSPGPVGAARKASLPQGQYHPPPPSAMPATMVPPPGVPLPSPSGFPAMQPANSSYDIPTSLPSLFSNVNPRAPMLHESMNYTNHQPPIPAQYRGFAPVGMMAGAPASNAMRQGPVGRGPGMDATPSVGHYNAQMPYGAQPVSMYNKPRDTMPTHSHSRQQSVDTPNLESLELPPPTGPISKPAPIQRPSSGSKQRIDGRRASLQAEIDDLSNHLGSSALIDGNDEPFNPDMALGRRSSAAPIQPGPRPGRSRYPFTSMYPPATGRMFSSPSMVGTDG